MEIRPARVIVSDLPARVKVYKGKVSKFRRFQGFKVSAEADAIFVFILETLKL